MRQFQIWLCGITVVARECMRPVFGLTAVGERRDIRQVVIDEMRARWP